MVQTVNIAMISENTTLNALNNFYLINATAGNLTVTLPPITTNGTNYTLNRVDGEFTSVTVTATGTNTIIQNLGGTGNGGTGVTGNYTLWPQIKAEFTSYNNDWFITDSSSTIMKAPIFCTAFFSGSSRFVNCPAPTTATRTILCYFPYDGVKYSARMSEIEVLLTPNSSVSGITGTIDLRVAGGINNFAIKTNFYPQGLGSMRIIHITDIPTITYDSVMLEVGVTAISNSSSPTISVYAMVIR